MIVVPFDEIIVEFVISNIPEVVTTVPLELTTTLFNLSVPLFSIIVPPVFSSFPYVLEPSSPFPLSFISNVPLLFNSVLLALVNVYPFISIVIFLLSGTSNVSVVDINVASLNISIVSPVSASFIAS